MEQLLERLTCASFGGESRIVRPNLFRGRVSDLKAFPVTAIAFHKMITSRIVAIRKRADVRRINIDQISEVWLQIEYVGIESFVLLAVREHRAIECVDCDEELLAHGKLQIHSTVPAFVSSKREHSSRALLHTRARRSRQGQRNLYRGLQLLDIRPEVVEKLAIRFVEKQVCISVANESWC